jgi:hypothetical protein
MNELIVNASGTVTVVGDAGSVAGIIAEKVRAATVPTFLDSDGNEVTPAIIPDADDLAQEVDVATLRIHPWRLPKARHERLEQIRGLRDTKLKALDTDYIRALEGSHPRGRSTTDVAAEKQTLRDLPPFVETALAALDNTDDMDAYLPAALR